MGAGNGLVAKGNLRSQGSVICRVKKSGAFLHAAKDGTSERERLIFQENKGECLGIP